MSEVPNGIGGVPALTAALAEAKKHFGEIKRTKTVKVKTEKGEYGFSYAPLDEILCAVTPQLCAQGLVLMQTVEVEASPHLVARVMVTRLLHESGEEIASRVPLAWPDRVTPQTVASAMTYAARQGVTRLLCLAPEDDDDANIAEGNTIVEQSEGPRVTRSAKAATAPPQKTFPKEQRAFWALFREAIGLGLYDEALAEPEGRANRHAVQAQLAGLTEWPAEPTTFHWAACCKALEREIEVKTGRPAKALEDAAWAAGVKP